MRKAQEGKAAQVLSKKRDLAQEVGGGGLEGGAKLEDEGAVFLGLETELLEGETVCLVGGLAVDHEPGHLLVERSLPNRSETAASETLMAQRGLDDDVDQAGQSSGELVGEVKRGHADDLVICSRIANDEDVRAALEEEIELELREERCPFFELREERIQISEVSTASRERLTRSKPSEGETRFIGANGHVDFLRGDKVA
mgnify:CR=1 FL=1